MLAYLIASVFPLLWTAGSLGRQHVVPRDNPRNAALLVGR
jgi:hypothetical protein